MPTLPIYRSETRTPTPPLVDTGGPDPFYGVERTLDLFDRIQRASDLAEADNAAQSAHAAIDGAIQITSKDEQDPDAFKNKSIEQVQQIYSNTINGARNPRVKELLSQKLSDDMIRASTAIQLTHKEKQVLNAKGNSFIYLQNAERELSQIQNPVERTAKEAEIASHLRDTRQAGVWTPLESATLANNMLERDAYLRAYRDVDMSQDPVKELQGIQKRYPNLDPKQIIPLMNAADTRAREIERLRNEAEKKVHQDNLLIDTMDAVSGQMSTTLELNARAKARRYTPEEYRTMLRSMESGGVTNPQVATAFELAIRGGQLTDYTQIANSKDLDKTEKSRLMGLVSEFKDAKHYTKTPEYAEAMKELRIAVSRKGPMESLDPKEQQMLLSAVRELSDRVEKKEDPKTVSRDIQDRITPATQADKPNFQPRFKSESELISALKAGKISRDDAAQQALLFKQWQEYADRQQQKAAQPQKPASSQRR